jgi:class 3 adenylate cyclase
MAPFETTDPIKVLVVDDEPDVITLFELRFRHEIESGEFAMRYASNGSEALDVASTDPELEVVVTDLNMPGMSGLELLARLDELHRPVKTIVLTAYGDMANIRTAMMRGAFDFQVKPLDIDDLRTTIRKASTIVRDLRAGEAARHRAVTLEERNRYLTEVFGKYVSDDVVEQLLAAPDGVELGGETRTLTLLLADIRGFTRLAKELPPEQVVRVLNGYLEVAVERILARGGTINEILGDGLLVFFGAPIHDELAAEHAVAAGLELQLAMAELNDRHRRAGLPELAVGVAIHTGDAVVGTVGSHRRLKYTAVGPNVNVVGRIESYARGGQVLISEATHRAVEHLVSVTGHFDLNAKGAEDSIQLHVVRGLSAPYWLELPQSSEPMYEALASTHATIARVVDDRIGHPAAGRLLAVGRASARVDTALMLAPLDDVVLRIDDIELYGKVSESAVTDAGNSMITVVYSTVAGDSLNHLMVGSAADLRRSDPTPEDP